MAPSSTSKRQSVRQRSQWSNANGSSTGAGDMVNGNDKVQNSLGWPLHEGTPTSHNDVHEHHQGEGLLRQQLTEIGTHLTETRQILQEYRQKAEKEQKGTFIHLAVHDLLLLWLLLATTFGVWWLLFRWPAWRLQKVME